MQAQGKERAGHHRVPRLKKTRMGVRRSIESLSLLFGLV